MRQAFAVRVFRMPVNKLICNLKENSLLLNVIYYRTSSIMDIITQNDLII